MKLCSDSQGKNVLEQLDLGIVQAGELKVYELYIHNDTKAYVTDLHFNVNHKEVEIVKAPESLDPDQSGMLLVEWRPSITLKEGLSTQLQIEGKEIWK